MQQITNTAHNTASSEWHIILYSVHDLNLANSGKTWKKLSDSWKTSNVLTQVVPDKHFIAEEAGRTKSILEDKVHALHQAFVTTQQEGQISSLYTSELEASNI